MRSAGDSPNRIEELARRLIEYWALAGGLVLLGVVFINAFSLTRLILADRPFPGDFEIVEVGVAVAVFAFLPYCQLMGANVSADIFTARAGPRLRGFLAGLAAVVAVGFAVFLLVQMYKGLLDLKLYGYTTAIYQFPIWTAYVPILFSILLLIVAALISLAEVFRGQVDEDTSGEWMRPGE